MTWHLTAGGRDLQCCGFLPAGVYGNVALAAYGGCVGHNDQTTLSAMNPGLVFVGGEGNMGEAGDESNISEFETWSE